MRQAAQREVAETPVHERYASKVASVISEALGGEAAW